MITWLIILASIAVYVTGGLFTTRYLYGLWRANKIDSLLRDQQAIRVPGKTWRDSDTWRGRTLEEAQRIYMKPSPTGDHGEHLFGASAMGVFWPLAMLIRFLCKGSMWFGGHLRTFATSSGRKPARQIAEEARMAKEKEAKEKAARERQVEDMERELGWGK